jgi:tetratricopeptide (TPR) repeat protein
MNPQNYGAIQRKLEIGFSPSATGYATVLANAAHCLEHRVTMGWPQVTANDAEKALRLAHFALSVAGDDAVVLARCGIVLLQVGGEDEQALRVLNRAIEINPSNVGVQLKLEDGLPLFLLSNRHPFPDLKRACRSTRMLPPSSPPSLHH